MTDITDEQRAAIAWLHEIEAKTNGQKVRNHVRLLLDALPSELTNPRPVLPTEPGTFRDSHGHIWELLAAGGWYRMGALNSYEMSLVRAAAPFTRLVPDRPQITREQVQALVTQWYDHGSNSRLADSILALVNGAADD